MGHGENQLNHHIFISLFSSTHTQAVWLVVFTGTLVIGLDIGLGIGIIFSLLTIIIRTILYVCVSSAFVYLYSSL